jgi:transposase-like protein
MQKRICDACGKERELKGGKVCDNGHFICKECLWKSAGLFGGPRKTCPLCDKPLR